MIPLFARPVLACTLLALSLTTLKAQSPTSVKTEPGVSQALAQYRKKVLSNIEYTLHFSIPAIKSEKIPATETLSFTLAQNTAPLQIDFKEDRDHIKNITVNTKPIPVTFEKEHLVVAPRFLKKGSNTVDIVFSAGDLSLNRNDDYLYTLLVPDRARTLFPCFDQPNLKARFRVSLTLPREWQALANGPLRDSSVQGDQKTYNYALSDLIPTYLFSFTAGRFQRRVQGAQGRYMQFYYRETDSTKIRLSMDTIYRIHADALAYLEDYTQIPYPFIKFDFVAIPDFQYGGMEHVGAIDYKASTLFLDSGATRDQENARSNLIAHETSHMWFGDLVTMQWFNDVWMKEVFANFMADKITQGAGGGDAYELKFLLTHFPRAYAVDRTTGANPIRQELTNLQEAGTLYGPIIYDKAPVMMRQLERLMGKDAFRDGLREYLKRYSFGNATWPDLIRILDARTPVDLQAWNKVWVNEPGRPVLSYTLQQSGGRIGSLTIDQKGEYSKGYLLPQYFEIALVYPDRVEEHTVHMDKGQVALKELQGKEAPLFILFNSSGQGYGLFPVDMKMLLHVAELKSSVMRAADYINLYENMLSGNRIKPKELLQFYKDALTRESEELNLSLIAGHISDIYWRLLKPSDRQAIVASLETALWEALQKEPTPNKKKILFRTYQSIAMTKDALQNLYTVWKEQKTPTGVTLSEDDYTSLALNLTVKAYAGDSLLQQQLARISNPDRRQRLQFLMPALSPDVQVRDSFFYSLRDQKTRKRESLVGEALNYLHHPLRTASSQKYLKESLDMLADIQRTGDIFFPSAWLNASFGNYQTREAAEIVRTFLKEHPNYNPKLKAKILQAADPLFRAERLAQ